MQEKAHDHALLLPGLFGVADNNGSGSESSPSRIDRPTVCTANTF